MEPGHAGPIFEMLKAPSRLTSDRDADAKQTALNILGIGRGKGKLDEAETAYEHAWRSTKSVPTPIATRGHDQVTGSPEEAAAG